MRVQSGIYCLTKLSRFAVIIVHTEDLVGILHILGSNEERCSTSKAQTWRLSSLVVACDH